MHIRELNEDDAPAYWAIRLEALETVPFAFGQSAGEHRASSMVETAIRLLSSEGIKFTLGAFEDGKLIGTATLVREEGLKEIHKGHIYGVYVASPHRGKGVGDALIAAVIAKARLFTGLEQILLAVSSSQGAARSLYQKHGFQRFGTEPRSLKVGDTYLDEDHMILRLL